MPRLCDTARTLRSTIARYISKNSALKTSFLGVKPSVAIVHLAVTVAVGLAQTGGAFERAERLAFDLAVRRRSDPSTPSLVTIVAVTETDLTEYQWPLSDAMLAEAIERLQRHSPRAIGLDLYRSVAVGEGAIALDAQLDAPNVIAIRSIATPEHGGTPAPETVSPDRVGFNEVPLDRDGVVRRQLLFATDSEGELLFSLASRLAFRYLQPDGIAPKNGSSVSDSIRLGQTTLVPLDRTAGGYRNIDPSGYQILLDYRTSTGSVPTISLDDLLNDRIDPQAIRDRVVLIGSIAPSLRDLFATPFSGSENDSAAVKMPGVELHAQMVRHLVAIAQGDRRPWRYAPDWLEVLWAWAWILLGTGLAWRVRRPWYLAGAIVAALAGLWLLELGFFAAAWWIPIAWPRMGFLVAAAATLAYRLLDDVLHDRLTGLPNRTLLYNRICLWRRLQHTRSSGNSSKVGAIYLDLDRFKAVNDCLGSTVGDFVLVEVTGRLKSCLSQTDLLARVGPDEFAMVLHDVADLDTLMDVALQVRRKLKRPFFLDNGQPLFLTSSIGLALGLPGDRDPIEDAHTAMYRAKAGNNVYPEVFDPAFQAQAVARFQLEIDLRESMAHSQVFATPVEQAHWHEKEDSNLPHSELGETFRVYYQPLVRLSSGKISGFEALVRWQHPLRGLVPPGQFIPVTEEIGSIVPLGAWVLDRACSQTRLWQRQFPSRHRLQVSVNLSGKQLQSPDLVERIAEILSRTRLKPQWLKLEITESVAMEDVKATIAVLERLKALKVKLSIDDFGTGYSSLSYLNRFPVDTLKIDRSFVQRMENSREDREIVRTIVTLAHTLGMDAIAEGIETPEDLAHLRELGCDYGQGYWFAKPLPASAAAQLLARRPRW
ncbi:EAL domain-containing protein [Geitlerinema sp. CS-897]|nr:EAL domain-containing protein [Geitlerinema sp. CS-897]